jgi:hypothetical protein
MRYGDALCLQHQVDYVYWAKHLVLYHDKRHPLEMGEKAISEFLTYLAVDENVAASTPSMRTPSRAKT